MNSVVRSVVAIAARGARRPEPGLIRQLTLLDRAVCAPDYSVLSRLQELRVADLRPARRPIVVLAGSCDGGGTRLSVFRHVLLKAFSGFAGTVISGGTRAGVSGLVGDIQDALHRGVETIGYVPGRLPANPRRDRRYHRLVTTRGRSYSLLEPVQMWTDLLLCGVMPYQVKVLGFGGGDIAAAEYRTALALGAEVAVIEGSGRAADELLKDTARYRANPPIALKNSVQALRHFITPGKGRLSARARERLAQAVHENYLRLRARSGRPHDPACLPWSRLAENLKQSNREQADDIIAKLRLNNRMVVCASKGKGESGRLAETEVERLAEIEHNRWNVERFSAGWTLGKRKSIARKTTPYLMTWDKLPKRIKQYDREAVRKIPELLAQVDCAIERLT